MATPRPLIERACMVDVSRRSSRAESVFQFFRSSDPAAGGWNSCASHPLTTHPKINYVKAYCDAL